MMKRIISLLMLLVLTLSVLPGRALGAQDVQPLTSEELELKEVLDTVLTGVSIPYGGESAYVSEWSDTFVAKAIWGKFIREYQYSGEYLLNIGLKDVAPSGVYDWQFELDVVQKLTRDTFGRDFPQETGSSYIYVADGLVNAAAVFPTEGTYESIQHFIRSGDTIVAIGVQTSYDNISSKFYKYFEATFRATPGTTYGYTLVSLKEIAGNQNLTDLYATASSELVESVATHGAERAIDGNLEKAWVEGAHGVGNGEWIRLSSAKGSKLYVEAVAIWPGYQKNDTLFKENGRPSSILIEDDQGFQQIVDLYGETHAVLLDKPLVTSYVKITILEATAGTKFEDTCVSEIALYGMDSVAYFKDYTVAPIPEVTEPATEPPAETEAPTEAPTETAPVTEAVEETTAATMTPDVSIEIEETQESTGTTLSEEEPDDNSPLDFGSREKDSDEDSKDTIIIVLLCLLFAAVSIFTITLLIIYRKKKF